MAEVVDAATAAPPKPLEDQQLRTSGGAGEVELLPGHAADYSAATFCLHQEDHTLGNVLRYMLMKDPQVEFCGYSIPHPSEHKIHLRVQMYDSASTLAALNRALRNLEDLFSHLGDRYAAELEAGNFERYEEAGLDWDTLSAEAEAGRQRLKEQREQERLARS